MKRYQITENNITYDIEDYDYCNNPGKKYYLNKKLHRECGPAIECTNGIKHWYKNGQCHRDDGPACEYNNGTKFWCKNGKLHREDGPAVILYDGDKEYWYNGTHIKNISSDEELKRYIKLLSIS